MGIYKALEEAKARDMSEDKYEDGWESGFNAAMQQQQRQQDADRLAQFACALAASRCFDPEAIMDRAENLLEEFKKRTEGK